MQPDLPNLPPMPSSPNVAQAAPENMMPQRQPAPIATGGRRLRQVLTIVTGGSLGVMALVGVAQLTFRPGLRPTDVAAIFEAQTDLGTMNQKLGVEPGKVAFTEDEYREKIAEAERRGQASAELQFQKKLMVVQADKERVVGAYQTLYQRTNIIAQAGVQMESQALQFRQRLIEQTNGGRAMVINIYDAGCALGSEEACTAARNARAGMIEESKGLTEGDLARKVRELMAGIPDPASLVVRRDTADNGPPAIDR